MTTYKIKNTDHRPQAFRVRGGVEVVKPGKTRTLDLVDTFSPEQVEVMKAKGIVVTEATDAKAENVEPRVIGTPLGEREEVGDRRRSRRARRSVAETGGLEPQSEMSENGGVERDPSDTTTTTATTTDQVGPKA